MDILSQKYIFFKNYIFEKYNRNITVYYMYIYIFSYFISELYFFFENYIFKKYVKENILLSLLY